MKAFYTIVLLALSNTFMTFAWYGHLKFKEMSWSQNLGLISIILISWGIALFEYILQVPANRIGFKSYGGPFSLVELKVIQEVVTLTVFVVFSLVFFKTETLRVNHIIGFFFLVLAVYLFSRSELVVHLSTNEERSTIILSPPLVSSSIVRASTPIARGASALVLQ